MPRLAHHVFFTLKDQDAARVAELIAACQKYLSGHPGMVDFAVGRREESLNREVNGEFDVSLHTVFDGLASHDQYQVAPRHLTFIEENKENWASVLVLDCSLEDE